MRRRHDMPFGASVEAAGGVRFRLWAPATERVSVVLDEGRAEHPMDPMHGGWFECLARDAGPGTTYLFRLAGGIMVPDPASRFQPQGVHGASEVVDPEAFDWRDEDWAGRPWHEAVLYELHVGTFSEAGSYGGVEARLDDLVELGITAVELMPVAECPGARSWGYDGAYPFSPEERYGRPDELKSLVRAAHRRGLMVLLDVVDNHFGPEGNYLGLYAPPFFTDRHPTPWGPAIDFDGPHSRVVRDFFVHNALYWLHEYGVDGLRLDAVHSICDGSRPHLLDELAAAVNEGTTGRHIHLMLENDANEARWLVRRADGTPRNYTAQWNDDLHHALHVALTGEGDGYYRDYAERPLRHLGRALAEGFSYQGEPSAHRQGRSRGEPSARLPPTAFVGFLQNHDQIGNRAFGERIDALAPSAAVEAALAVLLLAPSPPLLFMGEEWGAPEPFLFFCDFEPALAAAVREGRRRELASFARFADASRSTAIPDPGALETFERSRLDWTRREQEPHRRRLELVRRLLALRHEEIVPRLDGVGGGSGRFELLAGEALRVDWVLAGGESLGLVAALLPAPVRPAPPRPQGRCLFSTHEQLETGEGEDELPPWSVAWYLRER